MNWKKIGKALLYPHIIIMIALVPIATSLLIYSMVVIGTESALAIFSYVVSAYTLTVWCFKIPYLIKFFKTFRDKIMERRCPAKSENIFIWNAYLEFCLCNTSIRAWSVA